MRNQNSLFGRYLIQCLSEMQYLSIIKYLSFVSIKRLRKYNSTISISEEIYFRNQNKCILHIPAPPSCIHIQCLLSSDGGAPSAGAFDNATTPIYGFLSSNRESFVTSFLGSCLKFSFDSVPLILLAFALGNKFWE